ncbi:MAG: hypothetical protein M1820_009536 [Bogoriella megaspora]|nr:MAG: hypothetical protein M1820_009536 [Bogoriella megaspora]
MFSCPSCLRHCLKAVIERTPTKVATRTKYLERTHHPAFVIPASTRLLSTTVEPVFRGKPPPNVGQLIEHKSSESKLQQPSHDERHLRKEISYLQDPLKLADHVRQVLGQDDEEKALAIARLASKNMSCIVSWNHIINWNMSKGRVNSALKIYNEMKKRAQFPDSHTYLLLLRGFADNPQLPNSVPNALKIYHSMSAAGAKVPPSIIHSNAMLKVCARKHDMDALWSVVSKMPDRGARAPDTVTFTTILNSLKQSANTDPSISLSQEENEARQQEAIMSGRGIWEDIVNRWREGSLMIDEDLTCAMGRLLLMSPQKRDWDDILSLIEQTMSIPRPIPRLSIAERQDTHVSGIEATESSTAPNLTLSVSNTDELQPGGEFNSYNPTKTTSATYVQPSNNTLSLIVEACFKLISKKAASAYWDELTTKFPISPDADNLILYLRCLRLSRSSSQTVDVLRSQLGHPEILTARAFRTAMSSCVRDKLNPNVMSNAKQILDIAENRLEKPDPAVGTMYLDLAMATNDKAHMIYALERSNRMVVDIRSQLSYVSPFKGSMVTTERTNALDFLKRVLAAYNKVLLECDLSHRAISIYQEKRRKLTAFVQKTYKKQGMSGEELTSLNKRLLGRRGRKLKKSPSTIDHGSRTLSLVPDDSGVLENI